MHIRIATHYCLRRIYVKSYYISSMAQIPVLFCAIGLGRESKIIMRKRIAAGVLALSLALIPVGASAASYRGNGYCVKTFKTTGGKVTASVSYAKNTGVLQDTVQCIANSSGSIGVNVKCCYNETVYKTKTLVNTDSLSSLEATKKVSSSYCYGKLALSGDTKNTLYADE